MEQRYGWLQFLPAIGSIAGAIANIFTSGKKESKSTQAYQQQPQYLPAISNVGTFDKYIPVTLMVISVIAIAGVLTKRS